MAIFKTLLKAARRVGPAAFLAVVRYGPQIRAMIRENPRVAERITGRFQKVAKSRGGMDAASLYSRIEVLKEQVTYLYASADSSAVARQASAWRSDLEAIQQAIPVVESMSNAARNTQRRKLVSRLDDIASDLLAFSLENVVEEADIADEEPGKHE